MTTCVVAAVAHWAIGLPWAAAFVLGAIISPTDAIAATSVAQRLGVPRRIVTVLEGESLVNDATGIVAYRIAVGAVVAGGRQPVERSDRELELAESRILTLLGREKATYSPRELVEHLKEADEEEISEEAISVALWDLIGRTDIVLTRDWKLRPSKPPATV